MKFVQKWNQAGSYHHYDNVQNQDVILYGSNRRFSVITLADGVSTCQEAKEGAQIACKAITQLFLQKGYYFFGFQKKETADFAVSHILYELRQRAQEAKKKTEEYSSTIASILFDKKTKKMLFLNLGDGMILTTRKEKCNILAMPANSNFGCPVTTTKNVQLLVDTAVVDAAFLDSVFICSDGAWKHMTEKNRIRQCVKAMLIQFDYKKLGKYLKAQNSFDDFSFISMNLKEIR